jgi:hypothetical protein
VKEATAIAAGIVKGGTVPGAINTTAVGYIGENLTATAGPTAIGTSEADLVSLTLTDGVWLISGSQQADGNTGVIGTIAYFYIKGSNTGTGGNDLLATVDDGASGVRLATSHTFAPRCVTILTGDANKTIKIRAKTSTGTSNMTGYLSAVRL